MVLSVAQADVAIRPRGKVKLSATKPNAAGRKVGTLGPGEADLIKARTLQLQHKQNGLAASGYQ